MGEVQEVSAMGRVGGVDEVELSAREAGAYIRSRKSST